VALTRECAQHVSAFVFGCTGVAVGIAGAGLTATIGGAALIGTCTAAIYEDRKRHSVESEKELRRIIRRTTDDWRGDPAFAGHDAGRDLSNASDALLEHLPHCEMSREQIVACATQAPGLPFPVAATELVLAELKLRSEHTYGNDSPPFATDFARAVISTAFRAAIENRAYFEKLQPHLLFEIARTQGLTISLLDALTAKVDILPEETARAVVDEWERRGHHASTLKAETIIALARRLPDAGGDLNTLVTDLIATLDAAEDLVARGERSSNFDAFADAVFSRVAERIEASDFDGAADAAQNGFEDWKSREAERADASRQTGIAILDTVIRAERTRSSVGGITRAEVQKLELDSAGFSFDALRNVQNAYYVRGRDKGVRLDLRVSVSLAKLCIEQATGTDRKGAALNDMAVSLTTLGARGDDTALAEAVTTYREALKERTRDRVPLSWAMTQNNLGNALATLGKRGDDTALAEAVTAYREALKEYTRDRVPLEWAATQNNLGAALATLGKRGDDTALAEAVTAYREALKERTRDRVPLSWAMTQNNLGNALRTLGARGDDTALAEAVTAYREALKERTRDRVPLSWAMTQNNLGNALWTLGARGDDTALADAVTAYREALKERTRDRLPLDWAMTQNNLGAALATLGKRGDDTALAEAVTAYREALKEYTRDRVPLDWAVTQNNLGNAFETLGDRNGDRAQWEVTAACFRAALEEWAEERAPYYRKIATDSLARAEAKLAGTLRGGDE